MRVLLIHPEDNLQKGPWNGSKWDRVLDLGQAGMESYRLAAARFGCAVTPLQSFRKDFKEIRRVKELLNLGLGRLTDGFGLDWWELTSILVHPQLESLILLQELMETLHESDEVYVSRPGFHASALRLALGSRLHVFPAPAGQRTRGAGHYFRALKKFPVGQLLEIFWDKTDPGYQRRGFLGGTRKPQDAPLVLLPTAYVNASRTAIAYAKILADANFLLVATRPSGWITNPPANVATAWLRSYASVRIPARKAERADLMSRWASLREELERVPEFSVLSQLGGFDEFPDRFARGLEIRDAWRNVLDREPVHAVLCADDSNPYTHIPLLLAGQRALPAIACHHGALDGRYMFKRSHADVVLAKGRMEQDYLVSLCGLPASQVEVGAPAEDENRESGQDRKSAIVLFSEPYEAMGGRGADAYQDILPQLADLALSEGRELVVKLHPAESISERTRLVSQTLSSQQGRIARVVGGPLRSELLDRTWFGITILSTVAVECALRGIPCFLCRWLESSPYGYIDQFTRFGAGVALRQPDEIKQIPRLLQGGKAEGVSRANFWTPIEAERFRTLLGIARTERAPVATTG